jgi:hypothetical protein
MWLVTGGLMLAYRVILPILASLTHQFTVSRVTPVGPDAVSIEVTGRKVKELQARGGHWLNWRFLTPELAGQPHPFSLSAEPTDSTLRITVRNLGEGTARLMSLKPGTKVAIEGPYGMFTDASGRPTRRLSAPHRDRPDRALLESTASPRATPPSSCASTPDELYLLMRSSHCASWEPRPRCSSARALVIVVPVTDAGATLTSSPGPPG